MTFANRQIDFRSRDPDEVLGWLRGNFGDHTRVLHERGPFAFEMRGAFAGRIFAGWVNRRLAQTVRAHVSSPALHIPLTIEGTYRIGRRTLRSTPGKAVFLAPGHEYSLHDRGGAGHGLWIDEELLWKALEARLPSWRARRTFRCFELPLAPDEVAWLQGLRRRLTQDQAGGAQPPGRGAPTPLEAQVVDWMADRIVRYNGFEPVSPVSLRAIDRLKAWIDRHLHEQISVERLSRALGISERCLQKLCVAAHGVSPLEFVQSRRLAAVRRLLEEGRGSASVSQAALDCGFTHLGRFASLYRRAYGERPSDTLVRTAGQSHGEARRATSDRPVVHSSPAGA